MGANHVFVRISTPRHINIHSVLISQFWFGKRIKGIDLAQSDDKMQRQTKRKWTRPDVVQWKNPYTVIKLKR